MEVEATQSAQSPYADYRVAGNRGQLGKDDFLALLVAQLKYQDPMNPASNTEFIGQLAQLQALEQAQQMNEALLALGYLSQMSQASSLIGRTVSAITLADGPISGTVSEVRLVDGVAELMVGGVPVQLHEITKVL